MYNKFLLTLNTLLLFKQKEEKKRLRYITQKEDVMRLILSLSNSVVPENSQDNFKLMISKIPRN